MPKLKRISGKDLLALLLREGFLLLRQKSSHVRLVMKTENASHFVTIPLHDELDRGTEKAIIRSLGRCLSQEKIEQLFYTE